MGERLDSYLSSKFPEFSRSYFSKIIKEEKVSVNGKAVKPSYKLNAKDLIEVSQVNEATEGEPLPEKIVLDIVYEDDNVIVLNKQPGIVVHPAAGNKEGTLVNALLQYFPKIKEAVYEKDNLISKQRPGLVHRLDKDTSGVMIVAKNKRAMHSLARQIQNRTIKKIYWALCCGWPKNDEGILVNYLGRHPKNRKMIADIGNEKGREAISDYKVLRYFEDQAGNKMSLLEFDIKTGRTHQIRVQAKQIGTPIIGDAVYGNKHCISLSKKLNAKRQLLHAKTLAITLLGSNKPSIFEAPLPEDFKLVLEKLKDM